MSALSEAQYASEKRSERERAEIPLRDRIRELIDSVPIGAPPELEQFVDRLAAAIQYDRSQM